MAAGKASPDRRRRETRARGGWLAAVQCAILVLAYAARRGVTREIGAVMEQRQYVCEKCGCQQYRDDQFQATGGDFARLFDIQNKRFITISCVRCGYAELYSAQTDAGMNVLDFLMS